MRVIAESGPEHLEIYSVYEEETYCERCISQYVSFDLGKIFKQSCLRNFPQLHGLTGTMLFAAEFRNSFSTLPQRRSCIPAAHQ